MRGVTVCGCLCAYGVGISTHTPHAGRDNGKVRVFPDEFLISTHTPHAGRDPLLTLLANSLQQFQLTRPMRGVTYFYWLLYYS